MVAWCCVRVAELQQLLCEDAQSIRPDRMAQKILCNYRECTSQQKKIPICHY
jgi:hypothetical protein